MRTWKWILLAMAAAVGLTAVLALATPSPSDARSVSQPPLLSDQQDQKEYYGLVNRIQQGEQLTISEKERLESLYKRLEEGRDPNNPVDNQGGPDAFGYFYMDNIAPDTATYDWIELRGQDGVTWFNNWTSHDDGYATTPGNIGFSFTFYGVTYTQFTVTSNGQIEFGTPNASNYWTCLPQPALGPMIMADMYDAHLDYGGMNGVNVVGYKNFGDYTVIEYDSLGRCCSGGTSVKFEVILYNTGRMKFQYHNQVLNNGTMGSIGIQDATGTTYLPYRCQTDGNGVMPISDGLAIWWFQPAGIPMPPSNLAGNVNGTNVALTWTDPTTDTNGDPVAIDNIQVWLGPVGSGQLLATVNPGVQTYTHTNAPNGSLTYNVRAVNDPFFSSPSSVTVVVGNPSYENDFDTDNGDFVASPDNGWQWGAPGWGGAHSDPNVWGAGLGGTYPNMADWYVTLSPEQPISNAAASVELWINYDVESYFETINFQISVDDGGTWEIVTPDGGYPEDQGWGGEPGWSGNNGGWQPVILPIGGWVGETPIFRFHFQSDGSVTYQGFLFDDMIIWGLSPAVFASVSGTVTLDGGSGNITQALVRSNGIGSPQTNPAANGTYTLNNVLVGDRRILASLAGYHTDTLMITLPEGGFTGANLTLRRLNPPSPTNLVATVESATGIVTLDWDTSTDPLVDYYLIYRKLTADPDWVFRHQVTPSDGVDTLTSPGIWQYAVTAVDNGVAPPPLESSRSNVAEVIYGELPPSNLVANGNFDDRIRLNWLSPGAHPSYQLAYDDSSSEIFMRVTSPNQEQDYFATRFTPPTADTTAYPLPVQTVNVYMERSDPLPNVWIAPDNGGVPDLDNAWMNWQNIGADASPGWLTAHADGAIVLEDDSDFWVIWQFPPGITGPGTGTDWSAPDSRSYWTYLPTWPTWNLWTSGDWMARVWVGGEAGWGAVLSVGNPSGYSVSRIPSGQTAPALEVNKPSGEEVGQLSKAGAPVRIVSSTHKTSADVSISNPFPVAFNGRMEPYSKAPALVYQQRPGGGHALDDLDYYKIYRDASFLAQDVEPPYEDVVGSANENVSYSYYVTAHYDNDQESGPTNTVNGMANMAPGAPTGLTGAPVGSTQMHLTWTDPSVNADATTCVDLANLHLYRDGTLLATVAPGVQEYTDTPPDPEAFYTWTVRGLDEVPNEGPASPSWTGAVISPWQQVDYDWVEINVNGTNTGLTGDDQNVGPFPLGFDFNYYDQVYDQVYVCSNGWVSFTSTSTRYFNTCLPDPQDPNTSLDILFDDLFLPNGGDVYYMADGDRFIVEWDHVPHIAGLGIYTMEIIIGADGSVTYNYNDMGNVSQSTIGVEDQTGSAASLQLWCNGAGFWQPTNQSAVAFWSGPRVYGPVSGHVTLDGGAGSVTQVLVRSNGQGLPTASPAANGDYAMDSVQVGNRIIQATLAGYHDDTVHVFVPEGGLTNLNFTMRRLDPPTPTGLVGSVNNGTGFVSLNWDNSTDPLVDAYRVYRKLAGEQNWTLIHTRFSSGDSTDVLSVAGIYQYTVTAVDTNVVPPAVESPRAVPITLLYGNLPPSNLVANGNFDDRIRLNWLSPGIHQSYQLAYDDSSSEAFYVVQFPNGPNDYFAVRFTPPAADTASYPMPIQTVNLYEQTTDILPNVLVCPDNAGEPDLDNPLVSWQDVGADASPGWLTVSADGQVMLNDDSDFWVVWQFPPGINGPGTGSDSNSPDSRSYWTGAWAWPEWQQWTAHDWMARVWLGGEPGWGIVMSVGDPFGYSVERVPSVQAAPTSEMLKLRGEELRESRRAAGPVRKASSSSKQATVNAPTNMNPFPVALKGALEPFSHAPSLVYQQDPRGGRALDDIVYYKLYKDGTFLANDTIPPYDDIVTSAGENIPHTYWVRAHYDNNQDSDTSNHAVGRANMAPGAPTALDGNPVGSSQMQLTWTDPAVNADGTPCVDLASVRIYRDGTLIGTVAAGVHQFTDTPPQPDMFYTWTVRGVDEVPNEGPPSTAFIGAVTSPWETVDYEWVEINGNGTNSGLTGDDQNVGPFPLGFEIEYFGQTYSQVYICSNGWVSFTSTSSRYWNVCLPDPEEPNASLDLLFDDLYLPTGGAIYYLADAANDRFIVEWDHVPHINGNGNYTMEVIIGSNGSIIFNYNQMADVSQATVGVEDATGGAASLQLYCNGAGVFTPANQTAVGFWAGPSGELQGIVRQFGTNAPLQNVRVAIMEGPEFTMTDATGFYSLPLEPGTYTVNYSRQGNCDSTIANVLIEDNNTTVRNMTLRSPSAQFSVTSISQGTWPTHDATAIFQISNNGGQCALDFSISDTSAWLTTNPVSGSVPPNQSLDITVNMSVQGLLPGHDYQSALLIQHEALGSPYVIPVTLSISLEAPEPNSVPTEFALYQNYPNPFNTVTSIRFDVPQESHVIVTLFNVMGQAVATVVDGQYAAGRHSIVYDAADLPSGMYLMKLDAGSYTSMKKMMLLK